MRSKLGLILLIAFFLTVGFQPVARPVFDIACVIVGAVMIAFTWVTAHLALLVFLVVALKLVTRYPETTRRAFRCVARAVGDAVRSVMPQDLDSATDHTSHS